MSPLHSKNGKTISTIAEFEQIVPALRDMEAYHEGKRVWNDFLFTTIAQTCLRISELDPTLESGMTSLRQLEDVGVDPELILEIGIDVSRTQLAVVDNNAECWHYRKYEKR
jgi:hypothetical protein